MKKIDFDTARMRINIKHLIISSNKITNYIYCVIIDNHYNAANNIFNLPVYIDLYLERRHT